MRIVTSIPDDIFKAVERFAPRTKKSRSRLFSEALAEYLARHSADPVIEAMNKACEAIGEERDLFVSTAAERILRRSEW
ncbi:MAG TPA: hypothetical protein VKH15_11675 [Candidatus Acidoferrum sp.]|nr:hypothetical protein [Candidatus Acidoferrum sp.]